MKKSLALIAGVVLSASAFSVTNDWENPQVNSINRLPARTYSMPLANEQAALTADLEPSTPYRLSLNGEWKYSWAGNPELRAKDFWKADFDDAAWFTIDVPSCVELRGFGAPGYVNVRYPHADRSSPVRDGENFAKIFDRDTGKGDYNPVSSYRTRFTVPAEWQGRDVILRFDGVYSAYYVWVNGKKVGYAEDSKLPSEFDITPFLVAGENLLCVEVYRWCDGSYLEDQDMTRYSGIFRDVTLWAKPKDGIWDFAVNAKPVNDYRDGSIAVDCNVQAEWKLFDAEGKSVAVGKTGGKPVVFDNVKLWSAEKPYLYTLVLAAGEDIRMKRVGFKEQKIDGSVFLVNGKPVKFKGVNRHETSPENGRAVSLDDMLKDITLMKRFNINTVRTSHYPNHHSWYDLCDRYGIYLVAEANVEGHEPDYGENGLGQFSAWDWTIVERNARHVVFYRNNPSVTMWSMGNETGHGDCFRHALKAVRDLDPTRPRHWERGNPDADVDSTMYPTVEWLEARGVYGDTGVYTPALGSGATNLVNDSHHTPNKCFFMCEYAHAMGNAIGNFEEYWQVYYAHPSLCGGCIWDWVDQAVWKQTGKLDPKTGKPERFLSYGGDHDEEPNDGPFNCNGVVDPERHVTAKLVEVGHVHRNLVVTRSAGANAFQTVFELKNRNLFTHADEFAASWALVENGCKVAGGDFEPPAVEPLGRCRFMVPGLAEALARTSPGVELFVNFEFSLKADELWAKKGHVVASDQVKVGEKDFAFARDLSAAAVVLTPSDKTLTVEAGTTKAVFCRKSGTLCELEMDGVTVLKDPAPGIVTGPEFACARAFVDNDNWLRMGGDWGWDRTKGGFYSTGLSQLKAHARPIRVEGNRIRTVTELYGAKSGGFTHEAVWTFAADGSVSVKNTVTPFGTLPLALPRVGLKLQLDRRLNQVEYYGRGPRENYIDRKTGSFFGVWKSTVDALAENYVRPQDNGNRSDVRWVRFARRDGKGVTFAASEPMFVEAHRYDWEDLEFSRHRSSQQRFRTPIDRLTEGIVVNLDVRQSGLGGASCGPRPMAKYIFPIEPWTWTVNITK